MRNRFPSFGPARMMTIRWWRFGNEKATALNRGARKHFIYTGRPIFGRKESREKCERAREPHPVEKRRVGGGRGNGKPHPTTI